MRRIREGKWAAVPGLLALAVGAIALSAYSGASSPQGRGPEQPIAFSHPVHVKQVGMNCVYCHNAAYKSPDPGLPAVATCMGCHQLIGPDRRPVPGVRTQGYKSAELEKLYKYADFGPGSTFGKNAKPIPWVRIHKLPEYVRFPHMRHVNAGVTCQTCHGQIQNMPRVQQAASLNMGWCVNCHVSGYDPKAGLEAAGYAPGSTTASAPQSGGLLVNTANAQTGVPTGGAGLPEQPRTETEPSQGAPGQAPHGSYLAGGVTKNGRRLARYDCANCHY